MGFSTVYRCLQELFPQIDARLLKAVAIENSKDADAAVEVVLTEILPHMMESAKSPIEDSGSKSYSDEEVHDEEESLSLRRRHAGERVIPNHVESKSPPPCNDDIVAYTGGASSQDPTPDGETTFWDANDAAHDVSSEIFHSEEPISSKTAEEKRAIEPGQTSAIQSSALISSDIGSFDELNGSTESEELILLGMIGRPLAKPGKLLIDLNSNAHDLAASAIINDSDGQERQAYDRDIAIRENDHQRDSYTFKEIVDLVCEKPSDSVQKEEAPTYNSTHEDFSGPQVYCDTAITENGHQADSDTLDSYTFPEIVDLVCQKPSASAQKSPQEVSYCEDITQHDNKKEVSYDHCWTNGFGNVAAVDTNVTRPAKIVEVDLLNQIIEDAKNNKKTLFSAMESIMKTMKEVEEQETAAEEAKEEAAKGSLDIYSEVEELKRALARAKEANDMHAGEVYGERAILAAEMRELQSRLLCLSDERDGSLAILDEMRAALEIRLAEAEQLRQESEREKLLKEESARILLREQEALMEKVVQESKRLQEEAEENAKLREFLMDRGRVVDTLQGEIAVICQDVRLLKEKFDSGVALSESISSGQTTCILASSSSSVNSSYSEHAEILRTPKRVSPASSVDGLSPKRNLDEGTAETKQKELLDEGWEFCGNEKEF